MAFNRFNAPDKATYRALVTSQRDGQIVVDIVQYQPTKRLADGGYVYGISLQKAHGRSTVFTLTRDSFNELVDAAPFIKSKIKQLEFDCKHKTATLENSATNTEVLTDAATTEIRADDNCVTATDNGELRYFAQSNLV